MRRKKCFFLSWSFFLLFILTFPSCSSDSDTGGNGGLVGRYWARHEFNMEQFINKVDNAGPFWELWNEYGCANYNSGGKFFYFANKNTVHVSSYVGVKSKYYAIQLGYNDLLFTQTYGDDIVYYYGDLDNPSICSYEILDGKLYIYTNSDFDQYNIVDGGFVENGGHILYKQLELKSEFVKENPKVKITEGQKVDLGLSVKWAGWNIGAKSPEEYGGYYAWGEVVEKYNYSEDYYTCDWDKLSEMNIGGTEYDVATTKWGKDWRLPSKENFEELMDKCKWNLIRYKDVYGARVEGPNGNSIFLPIPGIKIGNKLHDEKYDSQYLIGSPRELSLTTGPLKTVDILTLKLGVNLDVITATTYYCGFAFNGSSVRAVSEN